MLANELPRTTVAFSVGDDIVERMHAVVQGESRYILDNSPFYAFDISYGDVFVASPIDGELVFSRVESRSGHSTYRIRLPVGRDHDIFLENWPELAKLGCTYEGSSANPERLYAIDVPPGADVFEVYRLLEKGELQGTWTFEEGHYFNPTKAQKGPG